MEVFANFLSKELEDSIEQSAFNLPWYFSKHTSELDSLSDYHKIPNTLDTPYFVNLLGCHDHGTSADDVRLFVPIIRKLEEKSGRSFLPRIQRIKANFYPRRVDYPEGFYHEPHVDMWDEENKCADEGEIFLYYPNDSDGHTYFFKEPFGAKEYTVANAFYPIKGMGVLFDNSNVHASSPPRVSEHRITLNFVFKK